MEDPRIRKLARFLIRGAVELKAGEKILIELHGSETGLMKALVQEAYAVGGKPFIHILTMPWRALWSRGPTRSTWRRLLPMSLPA